MGLHSAERNSLCVKTRERLSCLATTGVDSDTAGVSPDSLHSFLPCFIKNRYKGSLFGSAGIFLPPDFEVLGVSILRFLGFPIHIYWP